MKTDGREKTPSKRMPGLPGQPRTHPGAVGISDLAPRGLYFRHQAKVAPGELDPTRARTDNPTNEAAAAMRREQRAERESGHWWEERGWSDDYHGWVTRTSWWSQGPWQ